MDDSKLNKANKLKEEINELDSFISTAEKVWAGKLTIRDKIMRFVTNSYGVFESKEYEMSTNIKNKVLDVLIEYREDLKKEFESI